MNWTNQFLTNQLLLSRATINCDPVFTFRIDDDVIFMQFIRTNPPEFNEYWIKRCSTEISSPLDRRILYKQSTLPGHYRPFPAFNFEPNEFIETWIEFEIRGEKVLALKGTQGIDFSNLRAIPGIIPIITAPNVLLFNKYIASRLTAIQRDFETRKQAELKSIVDSTIDQANTDVAKELDDLKSLLQLQKNENIASAKKLSELTNSSIREKNDLQDQIKILIDQKEEVTKENAANQTKIQNSDKKYEDIKTQLENFEKDLKRVREQRNKYDDEVHDKNEELRKLRDQLANKWPNKRPRNDFNQQNYIGPNNDRPNYNQNPQQNNQPNGWNPPNNGNRNFNQPKSHQQNNWGQKQPSTPNHNSSDLAQREFNIKNEELNLREREIEMRKATLYQRNNSSSTDQTKEREFLLQIEKLVANQGMEHRNFQPTTSYANQQ